LASGALAEQPVGLLLAAHRAAADLLLELGVHHDVAEPQTIGGIYSGLGQEGGQFLPRQVPLARERRLDHRMAASEERVI
jgi:hypothetical protein